MEFCCNHAGALEQNLAALMQKLHLGQQAMREEQRQVLATIHEAQVHIEQRIGAVHDTANTTKAVVENLLTKCDMSHATEKDHLELFDFHDCEEYPPMVKDTDVRISGLVQRLRHFRRLSSFEKRNEKACRDSAIIPFFQDVARVMEAQTIVPDGEEYFLKVNVAGTSFRGKTDLVLCSDGEMPMIGIEMKPMQGDNCLKGTHFMEEQFKHRTQIVLQCVAFQSFCQSASQFSCILTNLNCMYVVRVRSYDASQISTEFFKCVDDERFFVRALLQAVESNSSISKLENRLGHPLTIFTAEGYECDPIEGASGGIPQARTGTCFPKSTMAVHGVDGNQCAHGVDRSLCTHGADKSQCAADSSYDKCYDKQNLCVAEAVRKTVPSAFCFEKWLPSVRHQKSTVKPNFVRAWLHMSMLDDCNS